ncbi:LCP family protein [Leucobacter sp. 1207-22]|uniref:LCP family protein n=1 Tax=Leucobacter sp. 1207-22 TaxID=2604456 RepID=UPI004062A485
MRHGNLRRSSTWKNLFKGVIASVLTVGMSLVAVAAFAAWQIAREARVFDLDGGAGAAAVTAGANGIDGELTILLVGSDRRDPNSVVDDGEEGDRNDVNLLLHIPASHESATVVSFPRDLLVSIPSCTDPESGETYDAMSSQQINTAVEYGGPGCVAATISELTGMEIPYVAEVDFDGVIAISDSIGGVSLCLAQPIVDPNANLNLPAGEVTLSGVEALNFVRTRYGVGDGSDVSRISNQQVFMSALLRQLQSEKTLSDPVSLYSLARAGFQNLTMSSSMASVTFLQAVATTAAKIDLGNINFVQYPTFTRPDDVNRLIADQESADMLFELIGAGQPFEISAIGSGAVGGASTSEEESGPVGDSPEVTDPAPVEPNGAEAPAPLLPENVTGQNAAQETCSAGRTRQ